MLGIGHQTPVLNDFFEPPPALTFALLCRAESALRARLRRSLLATLCIVCRRKFEHSDGDESGLNRHGKVRRRL